VKITDRAEREAWTAYMNANHTLDTCRLPGVRAALEAAAPYMLADDTTSDGYHTVGELYRHRLLLTATMFHSWVFSPSGWSCYRTRRHNPEDSEPMFPGMFKVGAELPTGEITYHYPDGCWDLFATTPEIEHSPKYDGHTSTEVSNRLEMYLRGQW
jgi:hypothetical protein